MPEFLVSGRMAIAIASVIPSRHQCDDKEDRIEQALLELDIA